MQCLHTLDFCTFFGRKVMSSCHSRELQHVRSSRVPLSIEIVMARRVIGVSWHVMVVKLEMRSMR
jgi:hypothetical protein